MVERFHQSVRARAWFAASLICLHLGLPADASVSCDDRPFGGLPEVGSSLEQVLLLLGSPKAVYLAGEDGERPEPRVTDGIVMAYEASYFGRNASVGIGLDACRVVRISILFRELVDVEELNRQLGVVPRHERRALLGDDLALELQIGSEHDPQGQQQMLIYPSLGIEAYLDLSGKGIELVELKEPLPSCDD